MSIPFPHVKEAKYPKDLNGRDILVGDEITVLRRGELRSAEVKELKLKTKKETIDVYRYPNGTMVWSTNAFDETEKEILQQFFSQETSSHIQVDRETQYYSIKVTTKKHGNTFSTPDISKIVVTGRP